MKSLLGGVRMVALAVLAVACAQPATTTPTGSENNGMPASYRVVRGKMVSPRGIQFSHVVAVRAQTGPASSVRAPVAADGTFSLQLPRGARYVVSAESGGRLVATLKYPANASGQRTALLPVAAAPTSGQALEDETDLGQVTDEGTGEASTENNPLEQEDSDQDGTSDYADDDDDGDGQDDAEDEDDDNSGAADDDEDHDQDDDGDIDGLDEDDDGDGEMDVADADDDGDGLPDEEEDDADEDGEADAEDEDDDNDGIPDAEDPESDDDGVSDTPDDADEDGVADEADTDDDDDGISDEADTDDDNDGISDEAEAEDGDADDDGEPDETDTADGEDGTDGGEDSGTNP
ncbi:MAG: hypothetical protein AB2A00_27880 [Myxococcota bacterium]